MIAEFVSVLQVLQPAGEKLFDFLETRTGRFLLSILFVVAAVFVNRLMKWQLQRQGQAHPNDTPMRAKWVRRNNLVWIFTFLLITAVWSNQIKSFLYSIAAVAGAMLVVSKDLILCLWGALIISLNKSLRIGSTIEVGKYTGQLVNTGFLTFELAEIGPSKKQTGRLLQLPNSIVFTEGIRNLSTYGTYGIHLIDFNFDKTVNLDMAEKLALRLASESGKMWLENAEAHFSMLERNNFVDLPKARPEVFWASVDDKCLRMTLRLACPLSKRGQVEKAIVKRFWIEYLQQPHPEAHDDDAENLHLD